MKINVHASGDIKDGFFKHPDLNAAAELMLQTWERPCWAYDSKLLKAYIHRPHANIDLNLGYNEDGRLKGFLSYIPYDIAFGGEVFPIVFASFWTVHADAADRFAAVKLQQVLTQQAMAYGFQGMLTIIPKKLKATKTLELSFKRIKLPLRQLNEFQQLIGSPPMIRKRLDSSGNIKTTGYSPELNVACTELIASQTAQIELSQKIKVHAMDHIMAKRAFTHSWLWVSGDQVVALINVMRIMALVPSHETHVQVEHYFTRDLNAEQQSAFLKAVFYDPYWDSIKAIHIPLSGAFNTEIFKRIGFFTAPSRYHLYWVGYRRQADIHPINSFYLDIF